MEQRTQRSFELGHKSLSYSLLFQKWQALTFAEQLQLKAGIMALISPEDDAAIKNSFLTQSSVGKGDPPFSKLSMK